MSHHMKGIIAKLENTHIIDIKHTKTPNAISPIYILSIPRYPKKKANINAIVGLLCLMDKND